MIARPVAVALLLAAVLLPNRAAAEPPTAARFALVSCDPDAMARHRAGTRCLCPGSGDEAGATTDGVGDGWQRW